MYIIYLMLCSDFFGAASTFSGCQLPTFREVGCQWKESRLQLEADREEGNQEKIPNRDVARDVIFLMGLINV